MGKIITPGDPGWTQPAGIPKQPEVPKLPDELIEKVFSEVVSDVQEKIAAGEMVSEGGPVEQEAKPEEPVVAAAPMKPDRFPSLRGRRAPGGPGFKYHRPAQQKSFTMKMPKPVTATLLEDLPRGWEKVCYVGDMNWKTRTRNPGFRKGDVITLMEMVFTPGVGAMYAFAEGGRGSFCVRPDQVIFAMPVPEAPADVQRPRLPEVPEGTSDQVTE